MLLAGPIQDDSLSGDLAGERLRTTFGASIAAIAADTFFHNPLSALERNTELERAEGFGKPRFGPLGAVVPPRLEVKQIAPEEANERFGELGLTFDEPVSEEALGIIVRRKREEITRRNIIRRGPQGVIPMGAKFLTSLAVSVIDPINVASAFIPVVGEARIASLVARFGKNSARFRTGLIEGAVGAAAVEPIILSAAANDQSDYTALDSLLNVAIGSILGGGLHVGVGKISDRLKAAAPETRESALRGSVAQMAEGRPVDAATILKTDPVFDDSSPLAGKILDGDEATGKPPHLMSERELDDLIKFEKGREQRDLLRAFGGDETAVKNYLALRRRADNTMDTARADEAQAKVDEIESSFTAEQEALVFGIGRDDVFDIEFLNRLRDAVEDIEGATKADLADRISEGMRRSDPEGLKAAARGAGNSTDQLAFAMMMRPIRELKRRGVADAELKRLIFESKRRAGFSEENAAEVLSDFLSPISREDAAIKSRQRIADASRRSADAATTPDPELGARASESARETELRVRRGEADDLDAELADLQTEIAGLEAAEGVVDDVTKIVDDAEQTGELARVAGRCLTRG